MNARCAQLTRTANIKLGHAVSANHMADAVYRRTTHVARRLIAQNK